MIIPTPSACSARYDEVMSVAHEPPLPPPPPPRVTPAIVALNAVIVGVAACYPWRVEHCVRYVGIDLSCEHTYFPAPIHGIGVVTLVALSVVAVLGVIAVWRPTKRTWRACGWGALVTGIVAFASVGFDRHKAMLDATSPGMAAAAFELGTLCLAGAGFAIMAMTRHLPSERLPYARVTARD